MRAGKIEDCRGTDKEGTKKKRVVKERKGEGWGRLKGRSGEGQK